MTYETKNITFHVIRVKVNNDSRYSRIFPIWMLQSRVHIVVVRGIHARIGLGRRDVESMVKYDQRQFIFVKNPIVTLIDYIVISCCAYFGVFLLLVPSLSLPLMKKNLLLEYIIVCYLCEIFIRRELVLVPH